LPRLLVVAPNWIGDALMAQPLLARLQEKQPGTRIDVLAPPWVAPVARRMPQVSAVVEAALRHGPLQLAERWRLGRSLSERGYDQAVVLPNSWKSALVPFFAGIPLRTGYTGEARYGLLNRRHEKAPGAARPDMRLFYAQLAEPPGARPAQPLPEPRLQVARDEIDAVLRKFGLQQPYVALCPGAEYGPAKRWPYFAELSRRLGPTAVALGAPGDLQSARGIEGVNLVGRTNLDEAIALIAGARSVVSNDSGLMHVAAALGRPLVALFGSSSPEHTPPASAAARVLWLHVECSPCYQRECPLGHFRCMRELSVDRVVSELQGL
jgi:heptosyltransferase II